MWYNGSMQIRTTPNVDEVIAGLSSGKRQDPIRFKKVGKALLILAENPRHPGLNSHRYEALDSTFKAQVWESYIENNVPTAWRIWWMYGPDPDTITVLSVGPHP
jgi:hypothetical protein